MKEFIVGHWQVFATLAGCVALLMGYRVVRRVVSKYRGLPRGWFLKTVMLAVVVVAGIYFFPWWWGPAYHINDEVEIVYPRSDVNGETGIIRSWNCLAPGNGYVYSVYCKGDEPYGLRFEHLKRLNGPHIPGIPILVLMAVGVCVVIYLRLPVLNKSSSNFGY